MAHAAAVIGLRVPDVVGRDVACTAKTLPAVSSAVGGARRERFRGQRQRRADPEAETGVRRGRRAGASHPVVAVASPHQDPPQARRRDRRFRGRGRPRAVHGDRRRGAGDGATAMRARELGRKSVVVGDEVALVGDVSGRPGSLARIVRVEERRSVLPRTADDDDTTAEGRIERVVVANADQLVIVSALADPPPRTGFIDRCLVAAYAADIEPLLCLTKADLAGAGASVLDYYAELDVPHLLLSPDADLGPLRERAARPGFGLCRALRGREVDVGQSADPERGPGRRRGQRDRQGPAHLDERGRAAAAGRAQASWIVDTPGVRSFGLAHVSADDLLHGFPDLVEGAPWMPAQLRASRRRLRAGRWVEQRPRRPAAARVLPPPAHLARSDPTEPGAGASRFRLRAPSARRAIRYRRSDDPVDVVERAQHRIDLTLRIGTPGRRR